MARTSPTNPVAEMSEAEVQTNGSWWALHELDLRAKMRAAGRCDYCFGKAGSPPDCEFPERHHNKEAIVATHRTSADAAKTS